jgi:hypothetical protein
MDRNDDAYSRQDIGGLDVFGTSGNAVVLSLKGGLYRQRGVGCRLASVAAIAAKRGKEANMLPTSIDVLFVHYFTLLRLFLFPVSSSCSVCSIFAFLPLLIHRRH